MKEKQKKIKQLEENKSFSHDVMAAILVDQNYPQVYEYYCDSVLRQRCAQHFQSFEA